MGEKENRIQRLVRILPWLALGCAFSPVLFQFANAIAGIAFGWSALLAPALMISLAARDRQRALPRRGLAQVLLGVGLVIQLIGLAGGSPSIARLGLPVAVVGVALWTGAPSVATAVLAFWALPIPTTAYGLTTPHLESAYAQLGADFGEWVGADMRASGPLIRTGEHRLELDPIHSGIHLAFVATQLVWYAAVLNKTAVPRALARMAAVALLALPLQFLAVLVAIALLSAGTPEGANIWLDHGVWLLTAIVGVAWIEARRP